MRMESRLRRGTLSDHVKIETTLIVGPQRPLSTTPILSRLLAGLARAGRITAELTKARLVSLVLVTTAVGFLLADAPPESWGVLVATLLGTGLTAAGSMILNEVWESARDSRMLRTRNRPLPAREITPAAALVAAAVAVLAGVSTLALFVNTLTATLGTAVVLLYVFVYTPLKARSTSCTLVGAICGAIPPMMGWVAATGSIGFGAWLLAAVLFFWQIPHFLALAWLYREDYERGGFLVLPVVDPTGRTTTALANLYILALLPLGTVAALAGVSGWSAAAGTFLLGTVLLTAGLRLAASRSSRRARQLFLATLVYLPLALALLVADRPSPSIDVSAGPLVPPASASAAPSSASLLDRS